MWVAGQSGSTSWFGWSWSNGEPTGCRELFAGDDTAARAARERAAGIRARLDAAADDYADGLIDRAQMRRITGKLRPELEQAEAVALRAWRGAQLLTELAGPEAAARWDAMTVVQRRALLEALGGSP